jgi:SAM-dependent methyltransferase
MRSMTVAIDARVRRYILDGSDEDLTRLVGIAQTFADLARDGFSHVGVRPGWRAIDCGCGPLGGLAVLADMVGPDGRVLGVDFNESTVHKARSVTAALGLSNVDVVAADLNEVDPLVLGGPFDLAYTRLFLMHQRDPVHTLRQIGRLLRPGGWLVAHEALRTPPPRSQPDLPALADYWALIHVLLERSGVARDTVENLPRFAREAGLKISDVSGGFLVGEANMFDLHASTLAAAREGAVRSGAATETQVDALVRSLRVASIADNRWVSSPFMLRLTLRKPRMP